MLRLASMLGLILALALASSPVSALTAKEKMVTCKFGADDQKLTGAARKSFLTRCMANERAPAPRKSAPNS